MAPIQHFKTAFWSQKQPELTLPDFNAGYSVLHQKLNQSKVENEEIIAFFKERISIEEIYASKLVDQGKSSFKNSGFGRDEGAGLVKCFGQLKETSRRFGEQHKVTASTVSSHVLLPLQEFHEEYKRNISNSKQAIDSMLKQFDGLVKEAEKTRYTYHRKCKEADKAEELAVRNATIATQKAADDKSLAVPGSEDTSTDTASATSDNSTSTPVTTMNVQLGNQVMPQSELDSLVRRMRQSITVNDHRVPILGTYKNTSTGEDIAIWLQQNLPQCKDSPAMADVVGQQLIQPYNILRLIGQRGNKFVASANAFYQWRVAGDDDTASVTSTSDTSSTYTALGGLMDKIAVPTAAAATSTANASEEPHKKARREAEKSDQAYRTAVLKLDQLRMAIEEAMFAHLTEMEQVELHRIKQLKKVISSFIAAMSVGIPQDKIVIEEMMVFQESLKPDQDIQFIVQQYAVSGFSPKAILYDNYYHGISHGKVFSSLPNTGLTLTFGRPSVWCAVGGAGKAISGPCPQICNAYSRSSGQGRRKDGGCRSQAETMVDSLRLGQSSCDMYGVEYTKWRSDIGNDGEIRARSARCCAALLSTRAARVFADFWVLRSCSGTLGRDT